MYCHVCSSNFHNHNDRPVFKTLNPVFGQKAEEEIEIWNKMMIVIPSQLDPLLLSLFLLVSRNIPLQWQLGCDIFVPTLLYD